MDNGGPRLEGVSIASIHTMNKRLVICTGAWFDYNGNFYQYDFYEPGTDKVNECTYDEVKKMIEDNTLKTHQPELGRSLRSSKYKS